MSYTSETGSVGFAIQDEKGTFKSPTDYMRVQSIDINPDGEKLVPDAEIGGSRDIENIEQGAYKLGGSIQSYVRPEAIGVLFYGALGKYTSSGNLSGDAYLHNFTPISSGSLPWISIKKIISDDVQVFDYTDCKVGSFSLDINANELANITFDIVGIKDEIGSSVSPSFEDAPPLVATKATITMDGSTISAKKVSVKFDNKLNSDDFRIGSRLLGDIEEKRREIDLSMDIVLDTTSELYRKAFYGSASATEAGFTVHAESVDIVLESPSEIDSTSGLPYKILLSIGNASFMAAPTPASGDELVVIPLELKAAKSSGENVMSIHIWNSKTTY